jgi:CRP-like cAMP-binding protein
MAIIEKRSGKISIARENNDRLRKVNSFLYGLEPLEGLSPAELSLIIGKTKAKIYPAGSMVFTPDDSPSENVYVLSQGRVDMYMLTSSGKRLVTRQIFPGSVFGMRRLFTRVTPSDFAEAVQDSKIYVLHRQQLLASLKNHPALLLRILEMVYGRLRMLEERLIETAYSPVRVRIAYFLLNNADPDSGVLGDITHEEIGDTVGAVRQTVTETLSILRKQGLIQTRPRQIRLIDRRGLEAIVEYSDG